MPAQVVVVLREPILAGKTEAALIRAGYDAVAITDPMRALRILDEAQTVDVLITNADFLPGQPNGLALARMTKQRRPNLKVIFTNGPEKEPHVRKDGVFIPTPTEPGPIVETVAKLMGAGGISSD